MPGSENLRGSDAVMDALKRMNAKGGIVCAICAAPIALGRAGLLQGKSATSYPGFNSRLEGANYTGSRVERDGNVITGKGAGASFEFAAVVAEALGKPKSDIKKLYDAMFVNI
jgi:protein deglycase